VTDQELDLDRRAAVQTLALVTLAGTAAAQSNAPPPPVGWESFPHLDEAADPTAIALKYYHDADAAGRAGAAKPGAPRKEQYCAN
jgi:hypothetical protein